MDNRQCIPWNDPTEQMRSAAAVPGHQTRYSRLDLLLHVLVHYKWVELLTVE